jgi:hypothetical protein
LGKVVGFNSVGEGFGVGNFFQVRGKVIPQSRKREERKAREKDCASRRSVKVVIVSKVKEVKVSKVVSVFKCGDPGAMECRWDVVELEGVNEFKVELSDELWKWKN